MKAAASKEITSVHQRLAERVRNVDKDLIQWNAFARKDSTEILTLDVLISTSARHKFAGRTQFASTPPEATTANASKVMLEIHLRCVQRFRKDSVMIHKIANVPTISPARQDLNATKENVKTCATR